jgi:transcriptional regulator with XRE-family HTH domain
MRIQSAETETEETLNAVEPPLQFWRLYRGLHIAELARRAGVTYAHIDAIEMGRRPCKLPSAKKFAAVLDIPIEKLL